MQSAGSVAPWEAKPSALAAPIRSSLGTGPRSLAPPLNPLLAEGGEGGDYSLSCRLAPASQQARRLRGVANWLGAGHRKRQQPRRGWLAQRAQPSLSSAKSWHWRRWGGRRARERQRGRACQFSPLPPPVPRVLVCPSFPSPGVRSLCQAKRERERDCAEDDWLELAGETPPPPQRSRVPPWPRGDASACATAPAQKPPRRQRAAA